jgi:hypothetical protein
MSLVQKKRAAWIAKYPIKPGMSLAEIFDRDETLVRQFPLTEKEKQERARHHVDAEFIL